MCLRQPDRILYVGSEACLFQPTQRSRKFSWHHHQVQILGDPPNPGVFMKRETSAYNKRDVRSLQSMENVTVETLRFTGPFRLARRGNGKRCDFFRHSRFDAYRALSVA